MRGLRLVPHRQREERPERGLLTETARRTPRGRLARLGINAPLMAFLVATGLLPLVFLFKWGLSDTADILQAPLSWWPSGVQWRNLAAAWTRARISEHFWNTVVIALGSLVTNLVVCTTAAYGLYLLRPRWARYAIGVFQATLFVPSIVLLVPLYLTVLDLPIVHVSLLNSYLAVWLPAGANAFFVLLVGQFFQSIPGEILEAAKVDGASPWRIFRSIVLPMSKPILAVVSIFSVIASWQDYLWPLLVLSDVSKQPLSVRLPALEKALPLDTFVAALALTSIVPILTFLVFQRTVMRAGGLTGSIKG